MTWPYANLLAALRTVPDALTSELPTNVAAETTHVRRVGAAAGHAVARLLRSFLRHFDAGEFLEGDCLARPITELAITLAWIFNDEHRAKWWFANHIAEQRKALRHMGELGFGSLNEATEELDEQAKHLGSAFEQFPSLLKRAEGADAHTKGDDKIFQNMYAASYRRQCSIVHASPSMLSGDHDRSFTLVDAAYATSAVCELIAQTLKRPVVKNIAAALRKGLSSTA